MSKEDPVMKKTIRWAGNLLIVAGVGLLVWQYFGVKETENVRNEQLEAFAALKAGAEMSGSDSDAPSEQKGKSEKKEDRQKQIGQLEGVLSIPQIDIHAPVLYGADADILDKGFGAIPHMDDPGEADGSYAIAGHQSHVFGQFFNRLDELEEGSRFTFETPREEQTYEVYAMEIVDPEDVEAIGREQGKTKLSMVTCYPKNSSKYRLIVMAERVDRPAGK